jgi:hypothetical protein
MGREYLVYTIAVACGFGVYFGLHEGLGLDFSIAMLVGFVAVHGAVLLGRRIL